MSNPYAPPPAGLNYNSQGATNTIQSAGVGLRLVTFPKVGLLQDQVQATAYGPGPEFCNLQSLWNTNAGNAIVRNVACYDAATRVDRLSFVTYTSAY